MLLVESFLADAFTQRYLDVSGGASLSGGGDIQKPIDLT